MEQRKILYFASSIPRLQKYRTARTKLINPIVRKVAEKYFPPIVDESDIAIPQRT
ncbi:hypothetical protein WMZ97_18565 [Lentibacillus sp. N15]